MPKIVIDAEGVSIPTNIVPWKDSHGITLCCAVLNESREMKEFIDWHKPYVDKIVIVDGGSSDDTLSIAADIADTTKCIRFCGHYGNQKNRAIELSETDWTLFMDPDERLSKDALESIRVMIDQEEFDCYSFPRVNVVDGVIDTSAGSDHQARLFRSYCRYIRPVHEELVGFKNRKKFPADSGVMINHSKGKERHNKRNSKYNIFSMMYVRELGAPGCQLEQSFRFRYRSLSEAIDNLVFVSNKAKQ